MDFRFERALITNCSIRGGMIGLAHGFLSGSFTQAAGVAAAVTACIYIAAKGHQFAADPAPPTPKGNG